MERFWFFIASDVHSQLEVTFSEYLQYFPMKRKSEKINHFQNVKNIQKIINE